MGIGERFSAQQGDQRAQFIAPARISAALSELSRRLECAGFRRGPVLPLGG